MTEDLPFKTPIIYDPEKVTRPLRPVRDTDRKSTASPIRPPDVKDSEKQTPKASRSGLSGPTVYSFVSAHTFDC